MMNMQELIQETLWRKAGRVCKSGDGSAPGLGVGSMLVESHAYILRHQEETIQIDDVVFFGQGPDLTDFRLCRMNLAIHGLDGSGVGWDENSCLERDMHPGLKADYILCEPPYHKKSSNFDWNWMRYIGSHLARGGVVGVVLPKDSLTGTPGETARGNETREYFVNSGMVKCIVLLPDRFLPGAGDKTSACLWVPAEGKGRGVDSADRGILFIDASPGIPVDSSLPAEPALTDIDEIATIFHRWQGKDCNDYEDEKGFCKFADLESVRRRRFDLSPEKYV